MYTNAPFMLPTQTRDLIVSTGDGDVVGFPSRSLYDTRDAAANGSEEYTRVLEELGFVEGASSPCSFHRPGRALKVVVHGDDVLCEGVMGSLHWLRENPPPHLTSP